jgi:hypothetical protein
MDAIRLERQAAGKVPIHLLSLTLKMDTACSSEMLIFTQKTMWYHNPEDHALKVVLFN